MTRTQRTTPRIPAAVRPVLAALVVATAWVPAEPAGHPPRDGMEVAAAAVDEEPTTTTASSTTTTVTTAAPTTSTTTAVTAPPTTAAPPPPTTVPAPTTTAPPGTPAPVDPSLVVAPPITPPPARDLSPYRGLGTWVDVYDFSPEFQGGGNPPVGPWSLDEMAAEGVRTLYLQAAKDDVRSPDLLVNPEILGPMLARAHELGIRVVAWYLPKFYDLDSDMARLLAIRDFRYQGQGFDGIGLDIEWRKDVPDHAERNVRLIELSRRLRAAVGAAALSAIPPPPVLMEVVNQNYWRDFPWRELAPLYDVWMPMAYWTFRTQSSGYKDGYRYTEENVRRLRANLGLPDAPVHPIGGTDNRSTDEDYRGFVRASHETRSIGGSIYDFQTTPPHAWGILRGSPS